MHEYLHVLIESLIDVAKVLPILFAVYYLIELVEYKNAINLHKNKLLKGKVSPVLGATMGIIPQCGFSIVSTDLFSKGRLSIGALVAVYIATSDEAIPLMIAHPNSILWMLLLIGVKLVFGIVIGYLAIALYHIFFKKGTLIEGLEKHKKETHSHNEKPNNVVHGGCCHHDVETRSFDWKHPLLHCLKIALFIFLINVVFGLITHIWVGEDKLILFLNNSKYIQPILAVLIGLIPNCASSVVLTELFLLKGLNFGALLTGLCVNSGLGLIMLFKQNKNWKVNVFIISLIVVSSLILGYALIWI